MNYGNRATHDLPPWFEAPRPVHDFQCTLFPVELWEVLLELRLSEDDLRRWHAHGWVSSGVDFEAGLEQHQVNEIRFVRDVVRSGLTDVQIAHLLGKLPRPMNFDPDGIAFSFSHGWVVVNPARQFEPFEIVDENVEGWLEALAEEEDKDRLSSLRDKIEELNQGIAQERDKGTA